MATAHEAMTDKTYSASREALIGANEGNLGGVNRTLTRNFERPAINNFDDRLNATRGALQFGSIDPHKMDPMGPAGSGLSRDPIATVTSKSGRNSLSNRSLHRTSSAS